MYGKTKKLHFVGIGGSGMSGLAEVLRNTGYEVSGSDLKESETVKRLQKLGCTIHLGHDARNIAGADVVIFSSAVRPDNVEVREARRSGIPVIPRAEMLAELMRLKYGVAVAGAHGKTTTTSLIGVVLSAGGLDPTVVVGGRVKQLGSSSRLGFGDFLVAEADESDGSFLMLSPSIVVLTTVDREHLNHYGTFDKLREAFAEFANKVPFYGISILCRDDPGVMETLPLIERRVTTYGFSKEADTVASEVSALGLGTRFKVSSMGEDLGFVEMRMLGRHNVLNCLAAVATGLELGIDFDRIRRAVKTFEGVSRRFELLGGAGGVTVVDDYGHHPTEIAAVLETARSFWSGRIVAVFQPHRYTRTRDLWRSFGSCFEGADRIYLTGIYPAGEAPIEGISAALIRDALQEQGKREVWLLEDREELMQRLLADVSPGELVITLGAGDISNFGGELLKKLEERQA